MKMLNFKKLLIGVFIIVIFVVFFVSINLFNSTSYKIESWQVNFNKDVVNALSLPKNIRTIDVTNVKKVGKYEAALINAAVKNGMNYNEIKKILKASDKQGPKGKIPVYIEADSLNSIKAAIVVYKNAYTGARSRLTDGQWVVIVNRKDYTVMFSKGTL